MRREIFWIGLGLLAGFLLAVGVSLSRPYEYRGSTIQQPYAAPDFILPHGSDGQFQLADQRGRLVLVFFGYTSCPDVCPTTLADMKQIRQRLGEDAGEVEFVFITVDPDRDVPDKVRQYVSAFDAAFVGLSGTPEQLEPVWKAYGVYHKANKEGTDDQRYEVEHSSQVYLIDQGGNLRLTYAFGTPVDDLLQDIRHLLKQKG